MAPRSRLAGAGFKPPQAAAFEKPLKDAADHFYQTRLTTGEARKRQRFFVEHLLCNDCEQLFSREYEKRSSEFLRDIDRHLSPLAHPAPDSSTAPPYHCGLRLTGFDYRSFKLFVLSVLWRISISKHDDVALGVKHEGIIQQMLCSGEPGDPLIYPILVGLIYDGEKQLFESMVWSGKLRGHRYHNLMFGGAIFTVFVSSHREGLPKDAKGGILHSDGAGHVMKTDYRRQAKMAGWLHQAHDLWQGRYGER